MSWHSLPDESMRILECARDGQHPLDYVQNISVAIGLVDQLLALGLLEEYPQSFILTEVGKLVLEIRPARGAGRCRRAIHR